MKLLALISILACAACGQVFSDDFTAYGTGPNFTVLAAPIVGDGTWQANWTVVAGSSPYMGSPYIGQVDIIGTGFFANTICRDAGATDPCVDLAGSSFPAGARLQSRGISLQPWFYTLAFDLAGSQRFNQNTVTVGVTDGAVDLVAPVQYAVASGAPFTRRFINFWVWNPATIYIYFDNSSNLDAVTICKGGYICGYMGALLKNVSLTLYGSSGRNGR